MYLLDQQIALYEVEMITLVENRSNLIKINDYLS